MGIDMPPYTEIFHSGKSVSIDLDRGCAVHTDVESRGTAGAHESGLLAEFSGYHAHFFVPYAQGHLGLFSVDTQSETYNDH
jgi:hypothetical protein